MRNNWTRDELILAFNLYCKLPYGRFNTSSKEVISLAALLGRTPGALAFKLVNFVSLDPRQKLLGRKGATNVSKLDREIFHEFMDDFDHMFSVSEKTLQQRLRENSDSRGVEIRFDEGRQGEDRAIVANTRVNQDYFRKLVLSNYVNTCGITGIAVPGLLIASHIKPWAKDNKNRLNPQNGICLSATFDKAFDSGLITISNDYKIMFSNKLRKYSKEPFFAHNLAIYENKQIYLPIKFLPSDEFLRYHREEVFLH